MAAIEPKTPAAPASVADRLAAVRAGVDKGSRRLYRLSIVSSKERPAPFEGADVAGHHFSERTYRRVEDTRGRGADSKQERSGTYENLTDAEAATIKAKMNDFIVRWQNRENLIAIVVDATVTHPDGVAKVVLDPNTDEPLAPYLSIEIATV